MKNVLSLATKISKKILKYEEFLKENELLKQEKRLISREKTEFGWPNGHYYSPVHKLEDLKDYTEVLNREKTSFIETIPGFSDKRIVKEFNYIKKYFKEFNYPIRDNDKYRFYTENVSISLMDGLVIYSMIRRKRPKKIIEIGSGYSSSLMIDVNEEYFNNKIDITFIEPFPELLFSRMKKGDKARYEVIQKGVQNVPLELFSKLEKGDILFIDSTHVSKFNSDVNYELFHILPTLKSGVLIHFHDILDGFEYPIHWLEKGWAWNEAYILRAFLMGNQDYEVLLMTNYLTNRYPELLNNSYSRGNVLNGGQLWLRKL